MKMNKEEGKPRNKDIGKMRDVRLRQGIKEVHGRREGKI